MVEGPWSLETSGYKTEDTSYQHKMAADSTVGLTLAKKSNPNETQPVL